MSNQQLTIAIIGLVGVLIGVLLRPIFEQWYVRRKKSLLFEWNGQLVGIGTTGENGIQLSINGHPTNKAYFRDFVIRNRTGSTLRDFKLVAIYDPPEKDHGDEPAHFFLQTYQSNDIVVSPTWDAKERKFEYAIERFDRSGKWRGRVMASYRAELRLSTDADFEVYQSDPTKPWHPRQLAWSFGPVLVFYTVYFIGKGLQ